MLTSVGRKVPNQGQEVVLRPAFPERIDNVQDLQSSALGPAHRAHVSTCFRLPEPTPIASVAAVVSEVDSKRRAIDVHDQQAAEFEERYRQLEADYHTSTFTYGRAKIEAILERELPRAPGAHVLDIGCGVGFTVSRLIRRGFRVTGVEPAEGMLRRARAANPSAEIITGDAERLPFPDDSFDAVIAIEVLRYIHDTSAALRECVRVLRPGGKAILTAAPRWSLNGYFAVNLVTSRLSVPGLTKVKHSFMSSRTARRSMRAAGFENISVHGAFLGPWHALQRVAPQTIPPLLRALEPIDDYLGDRIMFRDLSNHLVLVGTVR